MEAAHIRNERISRSAGGVRPAEPRLAGSPIHSGYNVMQFTLLTPREGMSGYNCQLPQ